ncbi:MAG: hypothetical protein ACRCYS_07225 [Beijerinckiaceae bacterium]
MTDNLPTPPAANAAPAVNDPKAGMEQNDRKYPRIGSTIRAIWDYCDSFQESTQRPISRKELLDTMQPLGYHPATLATQYAAWRRFHGITGTVADPAKADAAAAKEAEKAAKAAEKQAAKEAKAAAKAEEKRLAEEAKAAAKAEEKRLAEEAKAAAAAAASQEAPPAPPAE